MCNFGVGMIVGVGASNSWAHSQLQGEMDSLHWGILHHRNSFRRGFGLMAMYMRFIFLDMGDFCI